MTIYLDYAATTPVDPAVATTLADAMANPAMLANPSAGHAAGRDSERHVAHAADQLGALLQCAPSQIVWTSGATEADNLALLGGARYRARRGRHLVTMPTEHKAVTDTCRQLERDGYSVTWLTPDASGRVDLAELEASLREDTQLVSIMHVNNETGVTQDIETIGSLCRARDILFHVDAAQSVGKLPLDFADSTIDLLSLSAHKMYGPKGIGALVVADRPGCHVEPILYGGGQQGGRRPGTLPVPLIVAFGKAAQLATTHMAADLERTRELRDRLWQGIADLDGVTLNGDAEAHYPGILNVGVDGVEGESLLLALDPVCVATGSACNSRDREPSRVLRSMGRSDTEAQSAIRFSFGRFTRDDDIDEAVARYRDAVTRLRALAPAA
ncbi:MAG: aminotransferase class V-fold PLP-dependent enzyme [Pseudomonadota bacterium]